MFKAADEGWLKVFLEGDERYRQFLKQPCDG